MKNKAVLIGGFYDGQTREIDGKPAEFSILERVMERTGEKRVVLTSKYKLVSEADSPLRYEFEDSN